MGQHDPHEPLAPAPLDPSSADHEHLRARGERARLGTGAGASSSSRGQEGSLAREVALKVALAGTANVVRSFLSRCRWG